MKTLHAPPYILVVGLLALVALSVSACADEFLAEDPPHEIVADNLYVDKAGFEAGLNALYAQVRNERLGYGNGAGAIRTMVMTVGTDNAFGNYEYTDLRIFNNWGELNNPLVDGYFDLWSWLYETINAANTIIERADNPDVDWTETEKNEVVAEARLFRAWAYRHLTYLWGDVPLTLRESSGSSVRTNWERSPVAEVREQMEADLLFAAEHLPAVRETPGRLTSAVARHYLAELYLAMDQPAQAEQSAEAVITGGDYELITERYGVAAGEPGVPFMDQFIDGNVNRSQGNTEVLWSIQLQQDVPGGGENIMRRYWVNRYYLLPGVAVSEAFGGRGIGRLNPTKWALDLYEPGDDRGSPHALRLFYTYNDASSLPDGAALGDTLWLDYDEEATGNPGWPSTRKWDWADPDNVTGARQYGDQPYLRLAETYLLAAEAEFAQGKTGEAAAHINALRRRAGASEIDASDVTLDFILDERSRELLTEEHRRYTLLRTGKWLERTRLHNPIAGPNVTERDRLLPIPQAVIDANLDAEMQQNPGY